MEGNLARFERDMVQAMRDNPDGWMRDLLHKVAAATDARLEAEERQRAARRATPEARKTRSDAARRGWDTRRDREAAEAAEAAAAEPLTPDGPVCDEMNHDSTGREVFCQLVPDHDGDCDDLNGTTWDAEKD